MTTAEFSKFADILSAALSQHHLWGGGREEQPQAQGAVAARAQEGREELLHGQSHEGRP